MEAINPLSAEGEGAGARRGAHSTGKTVARGFGVVLGNPLSSVSSLTPPSALRGLLTHDRLRCSPGPRLETPSTGTATCLQARRRDPPPRGGADRQGPRLANTVSFPELRPRQRFALFIATLLARLTRPGPSSPTSSATRRCRQPTPTAYGQLAYYRAPGTAASPSLDQGLARRWKRTCAAGRKDRRRSKPLGLHSQHGGSRPRSWRRSRCRNGGTPGLRIIGPAQLRPSAPYAHGTPAPRAGLFPAGPRAAARDGARRP